MTRTCPRGWWRCEPSPNASLCRHCEHTASEEASAFLVHWSQKLSIWDTAQHELRRLARESAYVSCGVLAASKQPA